MNKEVEFIEKLTFLQLKARSLASVRRGV